MTIYLTIITTILVLTQIIRITQNQISLRRQYKDFQKNLEWIDKYEVKEQDFQVQKAVYYMLYEELKQKGYGINNDDLIKL